MTILTDTYIIPIHDLVIVILSNIFKNRYINKTNLSAFNILYFYVFRLFIKKNLNNLVYNIYNNFHKLSIL